MAKWFVPFFEQVDAAKLRSVDADPLHLSLLALEAEDCAIPMVAMAPPWCTKS